MTAPSHRYNRHVDLSRPDWLQRLASRPARAPVSGRRGFAGARAARALLAARMADLGFLYGTPLLPADMAPAALPAERLFLAVHANLAQLGHELADALARPQERREVELAAVFLAFAGDADGAARLARTTRPRSSDVGAAYARAARALAARAEQLTADPAYGVPLHNGLNFADAWAFGRIALGYFAEGHLVPGAARRRLAQAAHDKAALVEALGLLVWAEGPPSSTVRRALSRQLSAMALPRSEVRAVRAALERPAGPGALAARVRGREHRQFVLAQAILASLVDGRRSAKARRFLAQLAEAFGFTPDEVKAQELQLAAFYAEHREFVDTFTAAEAGLELADEVMDDLSRKVEKNLAAVMRELKQTGELGQLLAKAAAGQTLTAEERLRMRQDLVDVAKAVPSLAILAAPGGMLLLAALTRVLPFSILPSAWDDEPPADGT